jgi:large conductance mechanosensitive channel
VTFRRPRRWQRAAEQSKSDKGKIVFKGFKEFISRGNVVELAVAVVMGAAFSAIVNALVTDLVMPLITAIFGKQDYSTLTFTLNKSVFYYGKFINAVISFVAIAVGVYFFIVMPINKLNERSRTRRGLPAKAPEPSQVELLTDIRDALTMGGNRGGAN